MGNDQLAGYLFIAIVFTALVIYAVNQFSAWVGDLFASRKFRVNMVVGYGVRLVAGQKVDESNFTVGLIVHRPDWRQAQLKLGGGQLVCVSVT